ncbi:MAG: ATP phosphoribosyltransferase [Actinobacteria bacterium]|nr:ATP phosphoribosyltransferase [Actinomycetota bacterium]
MTDGAWQAPEVAMKEEVGPGSIVPQGARKQYGGIQGADVAGPGGLRLVLPKGSLEKATFDLFEAADLGVVRSSGVDYRAIVDDPRIGEVRILRPQEIPIYVEKGLFDLGITGRDWIEETGADVVSLGELAYSKATSNPIRVVLAVPADSPVADARDLPQKMSISTEYPQLTRRFVDKLGIDADIQLSYGATEAKVPDIVDAVVEITETGRALRAAGLKIISTLLVSRTELIANRESVKDAGMLHAMEQIMTLLSGALEARGKVLIKLNVIKDSLPAVLDLLPSMKSPTISELAGRGGYAVETVVPKSNVNVLIPELKDAGASDIVEIPIAKVVH